MTAKFLEQVLSSMVRLGIKEVNENTIRIIDLMVVYYPGSNLN